MSRNSFLPYSVILDAALIMVWFLRCLIYLLRGVAWLSIVLA